MTTHVEWRGVGYRLGKVVDHIYYVQQLHHYVVDAVVSGVYYVECPHGVNLGGLVEADIHNPRLMCVMPGVFGAYDAKLRLYLFADNKGYITFQYD